MGGSRAEGTAGLRNPVDVAVVDCGMGNLRSVEKALAFLGASPRRASAPKELAGAEALVLPGVGNFGEAARRLASSGVAEAVRGAVAAGVPLLGICLGMQLLFQESEEDGGRAAGLGFLPGRVARLAGGPGLKVPHMGWNAVTWTGPFPLLAGLVPPAYFYFVHSYAVPAGQPARAEAAGAEDSARAGGGTASPGAGAGTAGPGDGAGTAGPGTAVATARHGGEFVAAVQRGRVAGTQFHPEKSGAWGLRVLENFLALAREARRD